MEHRWKIRMPIKMSVEIYSRGQTIMCAKGRTRDLSDSGVYVEVNAAVIPKNTFVDVLFVEMRSAKDRSFQVPAIVMHTYANGLGLMFVDLNTEATERLIGLLQCHLDTLAYREPGIC